MQSLFDDHQVTNQEPASSSPSSGEVHTMQATSTAATGEQDAQPGGLNADSAVTGDNPVSAAVAASNYTHDDIALALSALSLIAWVLTTVYVAKQ